MIDKNKIYTLHDLIELFNMVNLEFKFYGNNKNGLLEFYMKTDIDKISVFTSIDKQLTKYNYLSLNEEEAKKIKFRFDREIDEMDLDIVAIVLKTSDVNIPSTKYSLETLDRLTKEQDQENREITDDGLVDGISYLIVDNNTACTLYDNVYVFNKNNKGLIEDLKQKFTEEKDELLKNNLALILDYYDEIKNKKDIIL